MQYKKNNNTSSNYFGVHQLANGDFQSRIMIENEDFFLGTYSNEIAAANMYNYYAKHANINITLNDVPYMNVNECLKYKNSKLYLRIPKGTYMPEIEYYNNNTATYNGVSINKSNKFSVEYQRNGIKTHFCSFDDRIAAANAYNWYISHDPNVNPYTIKYNDVPYMAPEEWLSHKTYGGLVKRPSVLCHSTGESDEERRARVKAKYGIDFL